MKCEKCRYYANGKCVMEFESDLCGNFKKHVEGSYKPTIERKELIDIIANPEYKPTPKVKLEVYTDVLTIDEHLEKFKRTGKINNKNIPIEYYDAYESMLYIKFLKVYGIEEFRKINRTKAFIIMLDGKESVIDENYKKLIKLLTSR